jgi:hypothetical protein
VSIELAVAIASLFVSTGVFGLLLKLNVQWSEIRERGDILWYHYCKEHQIPFRPTGRGFDEHSYVGDRK